MAKLNDLTGKKFGKLQVIKRSNRKGAYWICKCDCGNISEVYSSNLISGRTVSCGCYLNEIRKTQRTTHGDSKSRLYNIWTLMKKRCSDKNCKAYQNYGGRGISVCPEWKNDFESFKNWAINNGYSSGLTIDRIDNNGNYEPSNCRWADVKTQNNNNRMNVKVTINGETKTLAQWCEYYNTSYVAVRARRLRGWDDIEAITTPIGNGRRLRYGF